MKREVQERKGKKSVMKVKEREADGESARGIEGEIWGVREKKARKDGKIVRSAEKGVV